MLTNFNFPYWPTDPACQKWFRAAALDKGCLSPALWARAAFNAAVRGQLKVSFDPERRAKGRGLGRRQLAELGLPPGDRGRSLFQLKPDTTEIKAWKAHAAKKGLSAAEWCRQVLDFAAENGFKVSHAAKTG